MAPVPAPSPKETTSPSSRPPEKEKESAKFSIKDQLLLTVMGSLLFVAALAWNSAFQEMFEESESLQQTGRWIYAATVTVVALFATWALLTIFNDGRRPGT